MYKKKNDNIKKIPPQLYYILTNNPSKKNEKCGALQEYENQLISDVVEWTYTHGRICIGWPAKTSISSVRTLDIV